MICHLNDDCDHMTWWNAHQVLKSSYKGNQILEHAQNNVNKPTYIFMQDDVTKMADAYVNELAQHIDVANKENKRILNSVDLI